MSVFSGYLLINNKNKVSTIARGHYKDSDSDIISNNKLDNDSEINIYQKE